MATFGRLPPVPPFCFVFSAFCFSLESWDQPSNLKERPRVGVKYVVVSPY